MATTTPTTLAPLGEAKPSTGRSLRFPGIDEPWVWHGHRARPR